MSNNPIPYTIALDLGLVTAEQATIIDHYARRVRNTTASYTEGITVTLSGDCLTVYVMSERESQPYELRMIGDLIVGTLPTNTYLA